MTIRRKYILSLIIWAVGFLIALRLGAVDELDLGLIAKLRLPRAILASFIGLGLSVAGVALQSLFANPLCEPYTLGISSGAALGAVIGSSLGLQMVFGGLVAPSFVGAGVFAAILYFISRSRESSNSTLLLVGVMLGFFGSSLVSLWVALTDSNGVQSALAWLFGDLSHARLSGALLSAASIAILTLSLWTRWRSFDALLLGEEGALAVGIDVHRVRRKIVLLIALLIGVCVSAGGMIGFVGLVVPHFVRRWVGSLHLHLIPISALWGAIILMFADCLSRTLIRPYELPVGVLTSLIGAPFFLLILLKRREVVSG